MNKDFSVFVDSDVLISAMLSDKGAASLLIQTTKLKKNISNYSRKETQRVAKRLGIENATVKRVIEKCTTVKLQLPIKKIKDEYREYTTDPNDAHIVAGTVAAKVGFLITYNLKDYRRERIKRDLNIMVIPPAFFLQYLRSRD